MILVCTKDLEFGSCDSVWHLPITGTLSHNEVVKFIHGQS